MFGGVVEESEMELKNQLLQGKNNSSVNEKMFDQEWGGLLEETITENLDEVFYDFLKAHSKTRIA